MSARRMDEGVYSLVLYFFFKVFTREVETSLDESTSLFIYPFRSVV